MPQKLPFWLQTQFSTSLFTSWFPQVKVPVRSIREYTATAVKRASCKGASVSSFAERHSAWWFHAGIDETYNLEKSGNETAEAVCDAAVDWITRHAEKDQWMLHVHFWDPHTPYRSPMEYGKPFEKEELPESFLM